MQERGPQIDVAFASGGEQPRRRAVDDNADCRNHHDGDAGHLARRDQAAHTLNRNRANRHQKEHGIGERGQNGAAPQAIGVSL